MLLTLMLGIWGQMGSWGSLVSQLSLIGELQDHEKPCLYNNDDDDNDIKTKWTTARGVTSKVAQLTSDLHMHRQTHACVAIHTHTNIWRLKC